MSVLIVSYDSARDLPACLGALARQSLPRHRFEVVVVDNASRDRSADLVRADFPWVTVLPLARNLGFAGGNNAAARVARGDRLALLNPDTIPDDRWLEELVRVADAHPGRNVVSKLILLDTPGVLNSTGLVLLRDGRGADRDFLKSDVGQRETPDEVFAGCGAALLLGRTPDGRVLDSRLFLYGEDLDRGWGDLKRGRATVYAPRAVVRHRVGATTQSHLTHYYQDRNRLLVTLKHGDGLLVARVAVTMVVKLAVAAVRGDAPVRRLRALLAGLARAPGVLLSRLIGSAA